MFSPFFMFMSIPLLVPISGYCKWLLFCILTIYFFLVSSISWIWIGFFYFLFIQLVNSPCLRAIRVFRVEGLRKFTTFIILRLVLSILWRSQRSVRRRMAWTFIVILWYDHSSVCLERLFVMVGDTCGVMPIWPSNSFLLRSMVIIIKVKSLQFLFILLSIWSLFVPFFLLNVKSLAYFSLLRACIILTILFISAVFWVLAMQ